MTWNEYRLRLVNLLVLERRTPGAGEKLQELDEFYNEARADGRTDEEFTAGLGAPEGFLPEGAPVVRSARRFGEAAVIAAVCLFLSSFRFYVSPLQDLLPWAAPILLPLLLWFLLRLRQRSFAALFLPRPNLRWMLVGMGVGLIMMLGLYPFLFHSFSSPNFFQVNVYKCWAAALRLVAAVGLASALWGLWRCQVRRFPALVFWLGLMSALYFYERLLFSMDLDPGSGLPSPLVLCLPSLICLALALLATALAAFAVKWAEGRARNEWTHS